MAKAGPARPEDSAHGASGDSGELDETIENLTIEVAKAAKVNATPIIIGVILVVGVIMLPTILDKLKEREIQAWNNEIDTSLTGEVEEVRAQYAILLENVRGQVIELVAIERVARWLWDQGDDASRTEAVELLQQSQQRFPEDFVINSYLQQFRSSQEASKGFVLPEPPEPEPVVVTEPVTPEVIEILKPTTGDSATEKPKPVLTTPVSVDPPTPPTEGKPDPKPDNLGPPPPTSGGDGS